MMRKRMLLLYFIIIVLFLGTFCNLYNIVDGRELAAYAPSMEAAACALKSTARAVRSMTGI